MNRSPDLITLDGGDWQFCQRRHETGAASEASERLYYDTEYNLTSVRLVVKSGAAFVPREPGPLEDANWLPCSVPGSVQSALLANGLAATPLYHGLNIQSLQTATVGKESFFRRTFSIPSRWKGKNLSLYFEAVDYEAAFYVNGRLAGCHTGHYSPCSFEIASLVSFDAENSLMVRLAPFPTERNQAARSQILKNQMSDCTPAVCPLGISGTVTLRATGAAAIEDVWIRPRLSPSRRRADVVVEVRLAGRTSCAGRLEAALIAPDGRTVVTLSREGLVEPGTQTWILSGMVDEPELWWPNGYGSQPIYSARVRLLHPAGEIQDTAERSFGIRSLELAQTDADGDENPPFPWVFVVNGTKIYVKGGGWPPLDCFYRQDEERYRHFLALARAAHLNCIRWWGGGVPEPAFFYDLCDRLGLMVIHDFFMANENFDNPAFLARIVQDGPGFVEARRNHPSIVMWNGGNELNYRYAKSAQAQSAAAAILGRHDPDRPVVPSTPCLDSGQTHSITPYNYTPEADYERAISSPHVFATEGNCSSIANLSCLEKIIPAGELAAFDPARPSASFLQHNVLANWGVGRWNWLGHDTTRRLFGPIESLPLYIDACQYSRAECVAFAQEEYRRSKFRRCGTVIWQLVETWPNAAGNTLIDWFGVPKTAYFYIKRAFAPLAASLRYRRIFWNPGEQWTAELWIANDLLSAQAGTIDLQLCALEGRTLLRREFSFAVNANAAGKVAEATWNIPADFAEAFAVFLTVRDSGGSPVAFQHYLHSARRGELPFGQLTELPPGRADLQAVKESAGNSRRIKVRNSGYVLLFGCRFSETPPDQSLPKASFSDSHFHLASGQERLIEIMGEPGAPLEFSALNHSSIPVPVRISP